MRKPPNNLLDTSELIVRHPELEEGLQGVGAMYGKLVFAYRMEQGITQQQLADKAGVSLEMISRVEGGFEDLGAATYQKLYALINNSK